MASPISLPETTSWEPAQLGRERLRRSSAAVAALGSNEQVFGANEQILTPPGPGDIGHFLDQGTRGSDTPAHGCSSHAGTIFGIASMAINASIYRDTGNENLRQRDFDGFRRHLLGVHGAAAGAGATMPSGRRSVSQLFFDELGNARPPRAVGKPARCSANTWSTTVRDRSIGTAPRDRDDPHAPRTGLQDEYSFWSCRVSPPLRWEDYKCHHGERRAFQISHGQLRSRFLHVSQWSAVASRSAITEEGSCYESRNHSWMRCALGA